MFKVVPMATAGIGSLIEYRRLSKPPGRAKLGHFGLTVKVFSPYRLYLSEEPGQGPPLALVEDQNPYKRAAPEGSSRRRLNLLNPLGFHSTECDLRPESGLAKNRMGGIMAEARYPGAPHIPIDYAYPQTRSHRFRDHGS